MFGFTAEDLYPPQLLSLPATPKVAIPTNRTPKLDLSLPLHLKGRVSSQESKQTSSMQEQQQNTEQRPLVNDKETTRVRDKTVATAPAIFVPNQQSTSELFVTPTSSPASSPPPSPSKDHSFSHQKETGIDTFFSTLPHK